MVFRRRATLAAWPTGPTGLWQDGYYERVLRRDEDSPAVIDYILNNPVRAGLVDDPLAFPFSWSCLMGGAPPPHSALMRHLAIW